MIYFDENQKIFRIDAGASSYAMQVDPYGRLKHLYWGPQLDSMDLAYLAQAPTLPFIPEEFDPGKCQSPRPAESWEFAPNDLGTYSPASAIIRNAAGNTVTDPHYVSHRIYAGKHPLQGLPSSKIQSDEEATTLEILMVDNVTQMEFTLVYIAFKELSVIARSMRIANRGDAPVELLKASSLFMDFAPEELDFCYFDGMWGKERCFHRERLEGGTKVVGTTRGFSSHAMNPNVLICEQKASETAGRAYGALLVYSGRWAAEVDRNPFYRTRLNLGINPDGFLWHLEPGEEFQTPEALQAFSDAGFGALSRTWHDFFRTHIIPRQWVGTPRPLLVNNWEGMSFHFTKEKLLDLARLAKKLGIEMLVLDDGWFGEKRDDDRHSLGDWQPNERKLSGTIRQLSDAIHAEGMKFGLWFEPEMVSRDSNLFRAHPDWAIQCPSRDMSYIRYQYMLDFSRPEVVDHIYNEISATIEAANMDYMKWDANREMTEVGSLAWPPERQGEIAHRYILGVYDLYSRITKRFPDMLIEGCSAGGGRFDAGILCFSPQIWTSDITDALDRIKIQYGTSFAYPCSTMGAHVTKNKYGSRHVSVETRAAVAFAGTFGYELNLDEMPQEELDKIPGQCEFFRKYHHIVDNGDYYRLSSPYEDNLVAWMHLAKDKSELLLTAVITQIDWAFTGKTIRLPDLDESAAYTDGVHTWSGRTLTQAGYHIPQMPIDDMVSHMTRLWKIQ